MRRLTPEESRESWLMHMGNHGWDYVRRVREHREREFLLRVFTLWLAIGNLFSAATFLVFG